ncbi:Ca2+:H+ antiporter [Brevibacterium sanguinis]|uniref:Ca2+:H+ antiporter n=2 Tax=Brevibacterium TaxID=1696 RepID=A0A366IL35_9MICO|nr:MULTISPECIES: calcium:proton antiporter [Brevibacterium]RBP65664.1 Ca2+:H+ antiporter [Brevibacterium sanguinis]RBP72298.1 Ca2+:H+ antiporter [Brevibacterium celere]
MTQTLRQTTFRTVLTPTALLRLGLGWGAFLLTIIAGPALSASLPGPALVAVLTAIVVVIVVCAFGVVAEAEHLAHRLGDPYGTLVLTLSIVLIEVILISAVMLGPGEHATIARDSVMAVSMIILNLVVGAALLVGGLCHARLRPNRAGASAYLSMLVVLTAVAFALPAVIGARGEYSAAQEVPIIVLTVILYAFFLVRQMGAQSEDFREVASASSPTSAEAVPASIVQVLSVHRAEVIARTVVLVLTVVPIVLLSHDMAALLDDGLGRVGAPTALSGILIAMIVFLPETITTIRAAHMGEIQRVSNLCHGALVSTVGLTIPAVLAIGLLTGQSVVLAETPANLVLLGVTLLLTLTTFGGGRVTALHGAPHLLLFVLYALSVFA